MTGTELCTYAKQLYAAEAGDTFFGTTNVIWLEFLNDAWEQMLNEADCAQEVEPGATAPPGWAITSVASQIYYDLPVNIVKLREVYDDGNGNRLDGKSLRWMNENIGNWESASAGQPIYWFTAGARQFGVYPAPPDTSYTLRLYGTRIPNLTGYGSVEGSDTQFDTTNEGTVSPVLPTIYHRSLVYGMLIRAAQRDRENTDAQRMLGLWQQEWVGRLLSLRERTWLGENEIREVHYVSSE